MDLSHQPDELLREASCYGDLESIQKLIIAGANVNSQNSINGWSPLHWACKRGQLEAANMLLSHGANKALKNIDNHTAKDVTTSVSLLKNIFFNESNDIPFLEADPLESSPFTPSYAANNSVHNKVNLNSQKHTQTEKNSSHSPSIKENKLQSDVSLEKTYSGGILLRLRIADTGDPDFIEVELPTDELTYGSFLVACAQELCMNPQLVERVRKLPNIRLRNDIDIKRLQHFDYLEFVVKGKSKNGDSTYANSFKSISNFHKQTILY